LNQSILVFAPQGPELLEASEIVGGFLENEKVGTGVFQRNGKLVELPIAIRHAKLLQLGKLVSDKEEP